MDYFKRHHLIVAECVYCRDRSNLTIIICLLRIKLQLLLAIFCQKIHNVDVALNALKEKEVLSEEELNSVNPRHIVDGHREKTLSLLWMIILHFQVMLKASLIRLVQAH